MKRTISAILSVTLILMTFACLNITSFASFSPRFIAPTKSGWYAGYSRNNCVAYARCRANEILGYAVNWSSGNGGQGFWKTSGFKHGNTPKLGAIACWSGHCAVVESISGSSIVLSEGHYSFQPSSSSYKNVVINGGGGSAGTWFDNYYGNILSNGKPSECTNQTWYGYVYLIDEPTVDITTPTISFNKGSYIIGETAKITWSASPSGSNLKYYWLVITNTTTGREYHNASVSANSYSLKLTEAGKYKVSVYAIRSEGSGLSDVKTFGAGEVDISKPNISINKTSFIIGETAKIIWTASSTKSDLKYYWLVIKNTTTGDVYHNASIGTNSYDLKISKNGKYKVNVYAIRGDGSGESDEKTFGAGTVEIEKPIISFDKTNYSVGDTAKITWTASSSTSDLKYYWLVIKNTTSGKEYHNASYGTNTYNLNLTETGNYKVSVYTIRTDGTGESDVKTFGVDIVDIQKPVISFNKTSYLIGDTARITWIPTSSNADFKYYWLVVRNTTTGKEYHNASYGTNSYSLELTEAGDYRVAVYTIRNDGTGESDIKTFAVKQYCSHSYTSAVTKAATCIETGERTFTCSKCGDYYTQEIEVSSHNYVSAITEQPTCSDIGIRTYTCSVCGDYYIKSIDKLSHNYSSVVTKQATCSETGIRTHTCVSCGDYYTESIPRTEHSYIKSGITPTYVWSDGSSMSGEIEYKCQNCGTTCASEISAINEIYLTKTTYTYTGNVFAPTVVVKDEYGTTLKKGTDYSVTYSSGRKNVGRYTIKITFKGNYKGSVLKTFKILPKATSLTKLTAGKKAFNAKWKKQATQTSGYQLQYATNANYSGAKAFAVKNPKTVSKTINKLVAKKSYYVRIRTYRTVGGVNYFSAWSKSLKVKTK